MTMPAIREDALTREGLIFFIRKLEANRDL